MKTHIIIYAAALTMLLSGCSATRKCQDPQLELPQTVVPGTYADSLCMADLKWTELFSDTLLQNLIRRTLDNNKDMLTAAARVKELERLHRVAKSGLFPSITARGYANRETNDYTDTRPVRDPEIGLKASLAWEVDLFGKLRWGSREAFAEYMSSVEAQRAMQMTLISEVATAYFELIALDNELEIVMRTLETRKENVRQAKLRFDGGLTTEIPYQQSQVEYASTASMVPDLHRQIEMKKNEISLLAGSFPSSVERSLISTYNNLSDVIHVGLPSDLILRRPDLREAKQDMNAAAAAVGVRWAERFPSFNITLTGGIENDKFSGIFSAPFSYVMGELASPIFSFGRRKARYEAAIQAYEQERLQYEKKVLGAFREVNDAVISYTSSREETELMSNLKESSRKYVEIAVFQYRNGYINYIDVLDAQRSYFNAEIAHSNAVRNEFIALVELYKALGGGWS